MKSPSDTSTHHVAGSGQWDPVLVAILVGAMSLRLLLVRGHGAGFWGDETRYDVAVGAATELSSGRFGQALEMLFTKADHMGFKIMMLLPALGQLKWHWNNDVSALMGSGVFSVLNILWVYLLSRRLGGGRDEARWAAFMMAASASMLYWSRHLVPYDMSLSFALVALLLGARQGAGAVSAVAAGFLGFASFFIYNGSWLLVAFVLVAGVLMAWPSWPAMARRASLGLAGFLGFAIIAVVVTGLYGFPLLKAYEGFSRTITQGDFSEGHWVVWRYLWTAEHALLLLWCACLVALPILATLRLARIERRAWLWIAGVAVLGAGFIVLSNGAGKFVVYGRLVRMMVPFMALASGWVLARLVGQASHRGRLTAGLVLAVTISAAYNFATPLAQTFPNKFYADGGPAIHHRREAEPDLVKSEQMLARFRFINVGFIWPLPEKQDLPPHELLMMAPHPLAYEPYLFEGFDRKQREAFQSTDISMRLILPRD